MIRFVTLLFRGLPAIAAAILVSVSTSHDGHAQIERGEQNATAAAPQNAAARDLQTIIFQDTELWQQHVSIDGESVPVLYAIPCLRGNAELIANGFKEKTGVEISKFAAMAREDENGQSDDVWLGEYEDYSFLSTVRIATAPFRDPDLLPVLGTAYAFPLADLPNNRRQDFADRVLVGSVGVAEYRDGSYEFILPDNENWPRVVNQVRGQPAGGGAVSATHLVARHEYLFEPVNSTAALRRVISWNTDQPLMAVLMGSYQDVFLESMRARAAVCTEDEVIRP